MQLPEWPDATRIALDIETTGKSIFRDKITVLAVTAGDEPVVVDIAKMDQDELDAVAERLRDWYSRCTFLAHNAAFDFAFLHNTFDVWYPEKLIWDTMLAERLIYSGLGYSARLADVTERRLGVVLDKSLQTSFTGEEELTEDQLEYAAGDVIHLFEVAEGQRLDLAERRLGAVWEIERRVLPVFAEMWRRGIYVDTGRLHPLLDEAGQRRDELESDLQCLLTPYVHDLRLRKYDEQVDKLNEYLEAEQSEISRLERKWVDAYDGFYLNDNRTLTEGWEEDWLDLDEYPDGRIKGQSRYVKHHMKLWRQEHKRPPKPKLDTSPINLKSSQQMLEALNNYGIPVDNTKALTLEAALYRVEPSKRDEVLRPFLEYRGVTKLVDSFGETLIELLDDESCLHGNWNQMVSTGRPSCKKPNMLQMPKKAEFRACFRARPGQVFIVADYSQMELRILAEISGDESLIDAFDRGLDVHAQTAAGIYYPNLPMDDGIDQVTEDERSTGKTTNFSIAYGMGPTSLAARQAADGKDMTVEEAARALDGFRRLRRKAAAKIKELGDMAITHGYTATPLGRRRYFDEPENNEQRGAVRRAGANHPIQGANADITKLAMGLMQPDLRGIGGAVVLQVYDEIVAEVPIEHAYDGYNIVTAHMQAAAETVLKRVPVAVDAVISPSWSEKEAIWTEE